MAGDGPQRLGPGIRALVLTVSDGVAAGTRADESGAVLEERLRSLGATVERAIVADDRAPIADRIRVAAGEGVALVVTTGGTGLTPRDVTPQAVRAVLDYEIPGIGEVMRAAGRAATPLADLSRSLGGVVGRTLVICVPGSPRGAGESLAATEPLLAHALETVAGPHDHGRPARSSTLPAAHDRDEEDAG
ncbi:MAG: MogA/MoaB family molybdenum cofactor biosynthesis protein [Chloroflexi bacterium]|nr:MogA/MoaB family molybdenum cofactor biosynthesis protein [Chloroflexota bacterium]